MSVMPARRSQKRINRAMRDAVTAGFEADAIAAAAKLSYPSNNEMWEQAKEKATQAGEKWEHVRAWFTTVEDELVSRSRAEC